MDDIPPQFLCPITQELIQDPVSTLCGHTFERAAIEQWFEGHGTCPADNLPVGVKKVTPNYSLKSSIEDFVKQRPEMEIKRQEHKDFCKAIQIREEDLQRLTEKIQEQHEATSVLGFLKSVKLDQYHAVLDENGFDTMDSLAEITVEDLTEMKVKLGHARLIIKHLKPPDFPSPPVEKEETPAKSLDDILHENILLNNMAMLVVNKKPTPVKVISMNIKTKLCQVECDQANREVSFEQLQNLTFKGSAGHFSQAHLNYAHASHTWISKPEGVGIGFKPTKGAQNIVFIGPTGSGKSRLINFLVGEPMLKSESSLSSVTRKIEAVTLKTLVIGRQFNLIDTVGLLDTKLSTKEVLQLATEAMNKGFSSVNRFVIVLRQGRLTPPEIDALEQVISWFGLDQPGRTENCRVIITHCDSLSAEESKNVTEKYSQHEVVKKLFFESPIVNNRKDNVLQYTLPNFVCVGLPDPQKLDSQLRPIMLSRLALQRRALLSLICGYTSQPMTPTPQAKCRLL